MATEKTHPVFHGIYLENKGRVPGLLKEVVNELTSVLTLSVNDAMKFESEYFARKYLKENNLKGQFKPLVLLS